jgi:hypothetical protein
MRVSKASLVAATDTPGSAVSLFGSTTIIIKMEIGMSNSSPKSELIGKQLGSLYRLLGIYSDGAAWFLTCTSLISQHFPLPTYSMIHIPSLKAQGYIS